MLDDDEVKRIAAALADKLTESPRVMHSDDDEHAADHRFVRAQRKLLFSVYLSVGKVVVIGFLILVFGLGFVFFGFDKLVGLLK